jgi:hypothetical protein
MQSCAGALALAAVLTTAVHVRDADDMIMQAKPLKEAIMQAMHARQEPAEAGRGGGHGGGGHGSHSLGQEESSPFGDDEMMSWALADSGVTSKDHLGVSDRWKLDVPMGQEDKPYKRSTALNMGARAAGTYGGMLGGMTAGGMAGPFGMLGGGMAGAVAGSQAGGAAGEYLNRLAAGQGRMVPITEEDDDDEPIRPPLQRRNAMRSPVEDLEAKEEAEEAAEAEGNRNGFPGFNTDKDDRAWTPEDVDERSEYMEAIMQNAEDDELEEERPVLMPPLGHRTGHRPSPVPYGAEEDDVPMFAAADPYDLFSDSS